MDRRAKFTYKMIEMAVDRGVKYIKESGNRGVRYIVDLGDHLTKGKSQNQYFDIAQKVLNDEESKYYKFAKKIVRNIDTKVLKKFGVNLGYNAWTYGAKKMQEYEEEFECSVPWTVMFDFENEDYDLSHTELSECLNACESVGIYSGLFFVRNKESVLKDVLKVLRQHNDSAYFVFVNSEVLTDEMIDIIADAGNIALVLRYDRKEEYINCKAVSEKLTNKKCIFGISSSCNDDNIEYITDDSYLEDIHHLTYSFVCLIKNESLSNENYLKQIRFMKTVNNENDHSFFIIDFLESIRYIEKEVLSKAYYITVDGSGQVYTTFENKCLDETVNIKFCNMNKILEHIS